MIDAAQKDGVAARSGQIRVGLFTFDDDYVVQVPFLDVGAQLGKFFGIDFGGEDFAGWPHNLRRGKGESAVAGTDIGDDGARFPVHQRGEALDFVRGIGVGAAL